MHLQVGCCLTESHTQSTPLTQATECYSLFVLAVSCFLRFLVFCMMMAYAVVIGEAVRAF